MIELPVDKSIAQRCAILGLDFNKDTIDWVNDTMWASYGYYKGIKG